MKHILTRKALLTTLAAVGLACSESFAQTPIKTTFVSGYSNFKNEGAEKACDGLFMTKWCVSDKSKMPYTLVMDAGEKTAITAYGLCTGDDTSWYPDRNPLTWRVSGSNDKSNWTVVDEQKYNRTMRDENEQEYRFKVKDAGQYRYYRFEFIRLFNGTMMQLSEVKLYK